MKYFLYISNMERTIYLYIKESPLGLKYLGHTIKKDPYKYRGSGIRWNNHLRAHKISIKDIKTNILLETTDRSIISFWGMYYSKIYNVVDDPNWANLMPESGESSVGYKHTNETKLKISIKNKGKIVSQETIVKILKNRSSTLGFKHSDETKEKMSKLHKGKKLSKETIDKMKFKTTGKRLEANSKKVYKYSLEGLFLEEYSNIKDACVSCSGDVYNAYKGRCKIAGGYQWRSFKQDRIEFYDNIENYNYINYVCRYDLNGNFIDKWKNISDVSRKLNFNRSSIGNCLCGRSKTANGFIWKYEEN